MTKVGDRRSPGFKSAFILALVPSVIYLITRLWGIRDFPAFFFSDEANNVLFGEQVIQNGFVGQDGSLLPVYFEWDHQRWAPVLPVYLDGSTSSLFGKSILVARATTSLLSFLGAVAVSILLKEIFRIRAWWAAIFFLAIMPAWFLYSRTAFETVVATAFFAWFLLCYLLYRYRSAKWIYASVAFGAAAFYSYSNQQLPLLFLSVVLFVSDFKYHQMHKDELLRATLLAFLLALPFIQFQALHPSGHADHLRAIHSYWVEPNPFGEKLQTFAANYLRGISPRYWFFVINDESNQLPNQHLPNSGNLGWYLIPFVLVGLTICFVRFRDPAHRTIIFSALVIPVGAAIDSIEIPRVLAFVVPAAVMASLGLEQIYVYRGRIPEKLITIALQLAFSFAAGAMLVTALMNGPDWVTRHSPGSKEFAVKPVFEERLPELLEAEEDGKFHPLHDLGEQGGNLSTLLPR
ncbi:MAG: hypothetical protein P1P76_04045 [Anaerolineales bacterium]|nr:hypothetical protein [Anaerolineales bacterium]